MKIEKKTKRLRFCYFFVVGSTSLGALVGIAGKIWGIKEDALSNIPGFEPFSLVFGLIYLTCFIGMIKYMYDLDPGVQLRGLSKEKLEEVILNERLKLWHPKAIELLEKSKSCKPPDQ
jgi:hypothetical protein